MTIEKIKEYRYLIATFMEEERWLKEVDADLSPYTDFKYHESWDLLMPVITKINSLSNGHNLMIGKDYVTLTVEGYKGHSFGYSEYFTTEQTGKIATLKLIVKYLKSENNM